MSLVQTGDAVDDSQPEAGAGGVAAGAVEAGEGACQAVGFSFGDAGTTGAHVDPDFVRVRNGGKGNLVAAVEMCIRDRRSSAAGG